MPVAKTDAAPTLVAKTAEALSALSLGSEVGAFLGGEDELLRRLGVSRPTLRQAAKIAENDRLVAVRRGIKGGFYAARPDAADAIRQLVRFLRMRGATMAHIQSVNRLVAEEAAALAARCADPALLARLDGFMVAIDAADTAPALVHAENELARIVAAMSGNPAIELVMAIDYSFGMADPSIRLFDEPDQRAQARDLQRALCRAILDRDHDLARETVRRRAAMFAQWLDNATRLS